MAEPFLPTSAIWRTPARCRTPHCHLARARCRPQLDSWTTRRSPAPESHSPLTPAAMPSLSVLVADIGGTNCRQAMSAAGPCAHHSLQRRCRPRRRRCDPLSCAVPCASDLKRTLPCPPCLPTTGSSAGSWTKTSAPAASSPSRHAPAPAALRPALRRPARRPNAPSAWLRPYPAQPALSPACHHSCSTPATSLQVYQTADFSTFHDALAAFLALDALRCVGGRPAGRHGAGCSARIGLRLPSC